MPRLAVRLAVREGGRIRNLAWVKVCALAIALGVSFSGLVRDAEVEAQLDARMRRARAELGIAG